MSNTTELQDEAVSVPITDDEPLVEPLVEPDSSLNDAEFLNRFAEYKAIKDELDYVDDTLKMATERVIELHKKSLALQMELKDAEAAIRTKFVVVRKE